MKASKVIQKFKFELQWKMPFYGDIVAQLPFTEDTKIQTACTNGKCVLYNPAFLEQFNRKQQYFILLHELLHIMLLHFSRCGERDPFVWNIACDYMVNAMLQKNKQYYKEASDFVIEEPPMGTFSDTGSIVRRNVDDVYAQLIGMRKLNDERFPSKAQNAEDAKQEPKAGDLAPANILIWNKKGRIAMDLISAETEETEQQANRVRDMILAAAAKGRGDSMGFPISQPELQKTKSKLLPWRTLLRSSLTEEIGEDSAYATPERKYLHMDMLLPGHCLEEKWIDEIWVFIDCSGSISADEMNQFITQLCRILAEFHCTFNLCYWHTSVCSVYRGLRTEKDVLKNAPGETGGTDINCVYQWIADHHIRPEVLLILTDGYFGELHTPPYLPSLRRKTILVLGSNHPSEDGMPDLGKMAIL